jgi:hypothetical protein
VEKPLRQFAVVPQGQAELLGVVRAVRALGLPGAVQGGATLGDGLREAGGDLFQDVVGLLDGGPGLVHEPGDRVLEPQAELVTLVVRQQAAVLGVLSRDDVVGSPSRGDGIARSDVEVDAAVRSVRSERSERSEPRGVAFSLSEPVPLSADLSSAVLLSPDLVSKGLVLAVPVVPVPVVPVPVVPVPVVPVPVVPVADSREAFSASRCSVVLSALASVALRSFSLRSVFESPVGRIASDM